MWYISIQPLDYDDYPIGMEMKVGTFASKEDTESWMEESGQFYKAHGFLWQSKGHVRKHAVNVKNLLDTYMMSPEDYLTRGRK